MAEIELQPISIIYRGEISQGNKLDFYNGSRSLEGLARSFQISSHYFFHQQVIFQAPSSRNSKFYLLPSREGSFEQLIQLVVENPDATNILVSASAGALGHYLKEFINLSFRVAVGKPISKLSAWAKDVYKEKKSDLDALSESLDGPLLSAHRPISDVSDQIFLNLNSQQNLSLDISSLNYLKTRLVSSTPEVRTGTISSYNVNSKRGRFFDASLGRTVPFLMDKENPPSDFSAITWSLDEVNSGRGGEIKARILAETTITKEVKRYFLQKCWKS